MSGIGRTSVSTIPDTSTVTMGVTVESTPATLPPALGVGETAKIIGVTVTGDYLASLDITLNLLQIGVFGSNRIVLTDATTVAAGAIIPLEIGKYTAGDLIIDSNTKLELSIVGDPAEGPTVNVAYILVN